MPMSTASCNAVIDNSRRQRLQYTHLKELVSCLEASSEPAKETEADLIRLALAHGMSLKDCPGRVDECSTLAGALWERWETDTDRSALAACIEVETELLHLHSAEHPDRAKRCVNLEASLRVEFEHTDEASNLDEMIQLSREVLALRPLPHLNRHNSCNSLAVNLYVVFERTGDNKALDEAIDLLREALTWRPPGHPKRFYSCGALSVALHSRFDQTGDRKLFDEAIKLDREVVALCPSSHPHRCVSCSNLACKLVARFEQTGDSVLLDEANKLFAEALTMRPVGHPRRGIALHHLALMRKKRFELSGDHAILHDAISLSKEALVLRPGNDIFAQQLAALLHKHAQYQEDPIIAEEAIQQYRTAIELRPADHKLRHESCYGLAKILLVRNSLGPTEDYESLIGEMESLSSEILRLCPGEHPSRWHALELKAELALIRNDHMVAISYLEEMLNLNPHNVPELLKAAIGCINRIDHVDIPFDTQISLLTLYERTLELVVLATGYALDRPTQLDRVLNSSSIGPRAFHLACRTNRLTIGLELLERARGIIWSQAVNMRDPQLDRVPKDLAESLRPLLASMHQNPPSGFQGYLSHRDRLHERTSQLQQQLSHIRSLPELGDFMRGPDSHQLLQVATRNPVVVLISSAKKCHALVIESPDKPITDLLLDLDASTLHNLTFAPTAGNQHGLSSRRGDATRSMKLVARPSHIPGSALARLWLTVVKPVLTHLRLNRAHDGRRRPRIHWCPTGAFVFAPVHAAGIYEGQRQECCSDYVVSSYAPTLTALLRAQRDRRSYTCTEVQLATIAAEQVADGSLPPLIYVEQEAQEITTIATNAGVSSISLGRAATKSEITTSLELANLAHLACHGIQHPSDPHESRFCFAAESLTVSELMDMDLKNAFFAFLSACETAKGDRMHADEVIHLAATMLFAGFKSVVATMWAMNDQDGPLISKYFYEEVFASDRIDADSIPYALDHAVAALRRSGATPERWATFVHMGA